MRSLFSKNRKKSNVEPEVAPQLTLFQRSALEWPSASGTVPVAVLDQMQQDSMIQTALSIKKLSVLAAPFRVVPHDDSEEAQRRVEFIERVFRRMEGSPLTILQAAMDAFAKGWSVQEQVYEEIDGMISLRAVRAKDPSYYGIQMNEFGAIEGLTLRLPGNEAKSLPLDRFLLFVYRPGYERPKGKSDLEAAHQHWVAKNALLKAWKLHLERFASPTVLGKYQRGLPQEEQAGVLRALERLHDNSAIVFPHEIEIGTLSGVSQSQTSFLDAIEFHNREMARAILGQTLTTDEGRRVGSLALGKVHLQVLMLQIVALRRELADRVMTEQVIAPLIRLNFGDDIIPRFEFEEAPVDAFISGKV